MQAHLINKRKKRYVVITCNRCGQDNVFKLEHFLRAYVSGHAVCCKHCGQLMSVELSDNLEKKVASYMNKRR